MHNIWREREREREREDKAIQHSCVEKPVVLRQPQDCVQLKTTGFRGDIDKQKTTMTTKKRKKPVVLQ